MKVREIRKAVLANRAYDELDSDSDYEEDETGAKNGGVESDDAEVQQRSRNVSDSYNSNGYHAQHGQDGRMAGRLSTEESLDNQDPSGLQQNEMDGSRVDRAMMRWVRLACTVMDAKKLDTDFADRKFQSQ